MDCRRCHRLRADSVRRLGTDRGPRAVGLTFVAAWTILAALTALVWFLSLKGNASLASLTRWTPAGSSALLAVLVLTLAVAVPPLARVGAPTPKATAITAPTSPPISSGTRR